MRLPIKMLAVSMELMTTKDTSQIWQLSAALTDEVKMKGEKYE